MKKLNIIIIVMKGDVMRKKGYTLIELLAVMVVLAIVAVIAVPVILNVVEKARKQAAIASAKGYIEAIENEVALSSLKGLYYEDKEYMYDEIEASVKGTKPTAGRYNLSSSKVSNATFCIKGYAVTYEDNEAVVGEECDAEDMKFASTLRVSKAVVQLTYPVEETIEVIENTSGGALSCESSDTDVATCEISENNVIVVDEAIKK